MSAPRSLLSYALLAFIALLASGCATTQPAISEGDSPRVSAASFYRVAPWTKTAPKNIQGMTNAMVATTQGLADISSSYSQQLALQNQTQMNRLNSSSPYASRATAISECINVGGGRQGGMMCERLGLAAYNKEFGPDAVTATSLSDIEITSSNLVQGLGGWGGKSAFEVDNWNAGHEFGQIMLDSNRMWEDNMKSRMDRGP